LIVEDDKRFRLNGDAAQAVKLRDEIAQYL